MNTDRRIFFRPFAFDLDQKCLLRESKRVALRPKSLAVLRYLLEHPGEVVGKAELLKAAWPDINVVDSGLKVSIREIRKALDDSAETPRFIETVVGQGYRFIAPVARGASLPPTRQSYGSPATVIMVGRDEELKRLINLSKETDRGKRKIVFIGGEPGIGKTTLVRAFLESTSTHEDLWAAHGQCVDQYGEAEAYMPVLAALEGFCHTKEGEPFLEILREHAPTALGQMRSVLTTDEFEEIQHQLADSTQRRILREIAFALETLTHRKKLVLVLEDLHWGDHSTIALLSFLAHRQEFARLLLIGTYRPMEILSREHPLIGVIQELQMHGCCENLVLEALPETGVEEYLNTRFPENRFAPPFAEMMHRRTEGNPLFMVNVADFLKAQRIIVQNHGIWELSDGFKEIVVPSSIRNLIKHHLRRVSVEEREILEVGSVAGMEFSAAVVAVALRETIPEVEKRCAGLVRREQFLRAGGIETRPDATVSSRYTFIHAMYQEVLYDDVPAATRVQMHRSIGGSQEAGYCGSTEEIASELAMHFERGNDFQRSVKYRLQAVRKALRQCGYEEAAIHATAGLESLARLPRTEERDELELGLQLFLGISLSSTKGYSRADVQEVYARARILSEQIGNETRLFQAFVGLWSYYLTSGRIQTSLEVAQRMLELANQDENSTLKMDSHVLAGLSLFYQGDFIAARNHLEKSIALYDVERHRRHTELYGWDPAVLARCYLSVTFWVLGYPERDLDENRIARDLARKLSYTINLTCSDIVLSGHYQCRREVDLALQLADAGLSVASDNGFLHWIAAAKIVRGWALVEGGRSDGLPLILRGVSDCRAMGVRHELPRFLALLSEAFGRTRDFDKALQAVAEGLSLIQETGSCFYESELLRLEGEFLRKKRIKRTRLQQTRAAEARFFQAIDTAKRQGAKLFELRAVMSLCALWQEKGKNRAARSMLADTYSWFTEGLDTADLKGAKTLLDELS